MESKKTQTAIVLKYLQDNGEANNLQIKKDTGLPLSHINYAFNFLKDLGKVCYADPSEGKWKAHRMWCIDESVNCMDVMSMAFVPSQRESV